MADNIEQFLIQFVFDDKEAVKKIKAISKEFDGLVSKTKKQAIAQKQAAQAGKKEQSKYNDELRKTRQLTAAINAATKMGVDTTSYRKLLATSKDLKAIETATLELNRKTAQARLKSTDAKRQDIQVSKEDLALEKQKVAQLKKQEQIARSLGAVKRRPAFKELESRDPNAAASLLVSMRKELGRGTFAGREAFKDLNSQLTTTVNRLRKAERQSISLRNAQDGLRDSTRNLIRSYASMFAVFAGVRGINKVGREFESLTGAMTAATGSVISAQDEIDYLEKLSVRLGLGISSTSEQYSKFLFAAKGKLPTDEVRRLFTNVAEAGTALGMNQERIKLSYVALQQMMNKNQIKSEELKNQLAESFPGAIQIFAKAIGKSEQEMFKMMESGSLLASEIMPAVADEMKKVAASGGALETRLKGAAKAQDRFFTGLELASKKIYYGGFDKGAGEFFGTMTESINDSGIALESLGEFFKAVFKILTVGFKILYPAIESFSFSLGQTAELLSRIFGTDGGKLAAGIAAAVIAFGKLLTVANGFYLKVFSILAVIDEIYSLFTEGRVGVIELAMGKDVDWTDKIPEFMKGGMFVDVVTALAALTAVMWVLNRSVNALTAVMSISSGGGVISDKGGKSGWFKKALVATAGIMTSPLVVGSAMMAYSPKVGEGSDLITKDMVAKAQSDGYLRPSSQISVEQNIKVDVPAGANGEEIGNAIAKAVEKANYDFFNSQMLQNTAGQY